MRPPQRAAPRRLAFLPRRWVTCRKRFSVTFFFRGPCICEWLHVRRGNTIRMQSSWQLPPGINSVHKGMAQLTYLTRACQKSSVSLLAAFVFPRIPRRGLSGWNEARASHSIALIPGPKVRLQLFQLHRGHPRS